MTSIGHWHLYIRYYNSWGNFSGTRYIVYAQLRHNIILSNSSVVKRSINTITLSGLKAYSEPLVPGQ